MSSVFEYSIRSSINLSVLLVGVLNFFGLFFLMDKEMLLYLLHVLICNGIVLNCLQQSFCPLAPEK